MCVHKALLARYYSHELHQPEFLTASFLCPGCFHTAGHCTVVRFGREESPWETGGCERKRTGEPLTFTWHILRQVSFWREWI